MTTKLCHGEDCTNLKPHGRGYRFCAECRDREWAKTNRRCNKASYDRTYTPERARQDRLRFVYKITPETYDRLLDLQNGGCAGCGTGHGARRLHVDHDHSCCPKAWSCCGRCIRGLLCGQCNRATGFLGEDPARLRGLAEHLERPHLTVVAARQRPCTVVGCVHPRRPGRSARFCEPCSILGTRGRARLGLTVHLDPAPGREHRRLKYGLTDETYSEILVAQSGRCANHSCMTTPADATFHIDHDHTCCPQVSWSCGRCLRGLLCGACNRGAGYAGDSPTVLRQLALYIEVPTWTRF